MGGGGEGVVHASASRGYQHGTVVLRPMRAVLPKEAVLYTRQCGITTGFTPSLSTGTALRSVSRVLEDFVNAMMASYRTMVFNVLSTVERLEVHPRSMEDLVNGVYCNTPTADALALERSDTPSHSRRRPLQGRSAQESAKRLQATAPPSLSYTHVASSPYAPVSSTPSEAASATVAHHDPAAVLCLCCGCPLPPPGATAGPRFTAATGGVITQQQFVLCNQCRGVEEQLTARLSSATTSGCEAGDPSMEPPAPSAACVGGVLSVLFGKLFHPVEE